MASSVTALLPLAAMLRIPASALVALPTAVDVFAAKANMSVDRMIHECLNNEALRDYLAQICINAEKEVAL
jgi:hypothetical protein